MSKPDPSPAEALRERLAAISAEHAALWRGLSMTDQWRRLQALEGQLDLLTRMIQELEPASAGDADAPMQA